MDNQKSTILSASSVNISRFFINGSQETLVDSVAVESPVEIYVKYGPIGDRKIKKIAMIMRSPGDDLAFVVPSPNFPLKLSPHVHKVPSVLTAAM
jgi:hypothetical protein